MRRLSDKTKERASSSGSKCVCVQHELIERKNAKQIDKFATIAGSRLTSNRNEATTIASDGQAAEDVQGICKCTQCVHWPC